MILVGNQRGGAKNLALHLLKDENERVQVHQIRGFASDDLETAFRESYAMSRATRCKQHLFSLSLNPPHEANLTAQDFEDTVDRAEKRHGLDGQPRAIVIHTKNGRRHAHAVWSRIDSEEMRAVQMSFSKQKMQDLSRELCREHGWTMPRGFVRHEERDPRNFSLAEWQQCKRTKRDPAKTKEIFQDAWAISDSRAAFATALQTYGFILAKGDRRGHIAVDHNGEAYAISKYVGTKSKLVRDRLGKPDELPSKNEAHKFAANRVTVRLCELRDQEGMSASTRLRQLSFRDDQQSSRHALENSALLKRQSQERQRLQEEQQSRLRTGLMGFVDRLTGRRKRTLEQYQFEAANAEKRASVERQRLVEAFEAQQLVLRLQREKVTERSEFIRSQLAMDMRELRELAQRHQSGRIERQATGDRPKRQRSRETPFMEP